MYNGLYAMGDYNMVLFSGGVFVGFVLGVLGAVFVLLGV